GFFLLQPTACQVPEQEKEETPTPKNDDFNPNHGRFASLTSFGDQPVARAGHTAVWPQDRLAIFGGETSDATFLASGQLYEPKRGAWTNLSLANQPTPRIGHTAVATAEGFIIWGGMTLEADQSGEAQTIMTPTNSGSS